MIRFKTYSTRAEASVIYTFLLSNGLTCDLATDNNHTIYGELASGCSIYILESDKKRALELLQEHTGDLSLSEDELIGEPCPFCNSIETELDNKQIHFFEFIKGLFSKNQIPKNQWTCQTCKKKWSSDSSTKIVSDDQ